MDSLTSENLAAVRMPAEWEPHRRCWMAWPRSRAVWGERLAAVQRNYAEVARAIAAFEPLVMVADPEAVGEARGLCGAGIEIIALPLDDAWLRDSGPSFVKTPDGRSLAVSWRFNGWGCYAPAFEKDAALSAALAGHLDVTVRHSALAMEGGALAVDGEGTLLTTESVVMNENRNPGITRAKAEAEFACTLGIRKTIWLPGDREELGTNGHIDGIACFVRPGVVLYEEATETSDHREASRRNRAALQGATDAAGRRIEVVTITEAGAVDEGIPGWGFCRSYVNFYIANGGVIMPRYGAPEDEAARQAIAALFPDRETVQVDIRAIAAGGGGIHCITQQEPA